MWKTYSDKFSKAVNGQSSELRIGGITLAAILLVLATGCVARQTPTRMEAAGLPRPGAKVDLGRITNATGQNFEVDVEILLKDALTEQLSQQDIGMGASPATSDFTLNLDITEYRPGNAFKRWIVPGYGATVLGVEGELLESTSGTRVAGITHKRSVAAGGLYTLDAWKYIFDWIARDITKDLKVRIERGGEFVVHATPRADVVAVAGPAEDAKTIQIKAFYDRRPEEGRIGERKAAFGVAMGDVYFSRDVASFMKEALEAELSASGHRIVATAGDLMVTGEVLTFWVRTETTPLHWDVIADIEVALEINGVGGKVRRDYSATGKKRTYVWPSTSVLGDTIDQCMDQLMTKIREDTVWQ